jgi:hypothetical protein
LVTEKSLGIPAIREKPHGGGFVQTAEIQQF